MSNNGPYSSVLSEWLSRDLPNIGMKKDKTSLYLPRSGMKDCHSGVDEFDEFAEPKFLLRPKDYRAGAQNP